MRLWNLIGFDVGPINQITEDLNHDKNGIYRLLVYTSIQAQAVYISEDFELAGNLRVELADVNFQGSSSRHSFIIAVQLIQQSTVSAKWDIVKEWKVDLRRVGPHQPARTGNDLILRTIDGQKFVGADNNGASSHEQSDIGEEPTWGRPLNDMRQEQPSHNTETISSTHTSQSYIPGSWLFNWGRSALGRSQQNQSSTKTCTSLSYPALVDLWTLQHSIDDAQDASIAFQSECDELVPQSGLMVEEGLETLERRLRKIKAEVVKIRKLLDQKKRNTQQLDDDRTKLETQLSHNTGSMKSGSNSSGIMKDPDYTEEKNKKADKIDASLQIKQEQGRLASELLAVFPIEPVNDGKFHFSIHGIMLPSVFAINHYDTTQVGAALGFVAQVVVCISKYLDIALPYPITVFGSQSYITDNISRIKHGSVNFPLWTRGVLLYRVEYALYLLHKDIEQLLTWAGLAVADLKQTLANLKNLLLVVSCNK